MIKNFLYNSKNQMEAAYIWNTSAAMLNAFQTVFILMIISRIDPISDAGIFTIAFAIGNLMMTIGKYGTRQFQVSDINEKYSFEEYCLARAITCVMTIAVSLIYVGYNAGTGLYDIKKCIVIMFVCLAKTVDAFEDVLHGMMQQKERLDIAGKILTLRLLTYILVYMGVYLVRKDLILASGISLIVSIITFVLFDFPAIKKFHVCRQAIKGIKVVTLLKEGFPLFIAAYLVMYIGNAPKYAIDKVLSSEAQACFNYIFMPVFVIGLLSQFVYQPIISKMALMWHVGENQKFGMIILRQLLIISGLTGGVMVGGYILGIPVLSIIYGVDLQGYKSHLMVLLASGGMLALVNFFQMIITVARRQNYLMIGYVLAYVCFLLGGTRVVKQYGVMGISVFYLVVVTGIALVFAAFTYRIIKQKLDKGNNI